jgi:hypothetical protein
MLRCADRGAEAFFHVPHSLHRSSFAPIGADLVRDV